MAAREVSVGEFTARLSPEDRAQVGDALRAGFGVARYGSWNLSFGRRGAAIETTFPPAMYGSSELSDFVSPTPSSAAMRSPLMDAVGGPPQIARPHVSPSHTEHPSVEFETRTSGRPRGGHSDGFIEAQRFLPGREQVPARPEEPLTEEQGWWAERL